MAVSEVWHAAGAARGKTGNVPNPMELERTGAYAMSTEVKQSLKELEGKISQLKVYL